MNCKELYTPPPIKNSQNLLVIDGIVISGNDSSIITLSRTRSLSDTATSSKELNARVSVVGLTGVEYLFTDQGYGRYAVDQLALDTTTQYQIKVNTADGNEFRSEFSTVHTSPPIDSLYWNQDSVGVHVYLNTHDPGNNTKYYRWEYVETWEYHSAFQSFVKYAGPGQVEFRPLSEQIYRCYQSESSSKIEVASTTQLSSDVVNKYEVTTVPAGNDKMTYLYSDLIKQYAISAEAFNFWQNLKKNTEELGSLFDLQPFTELGNIRCVNNPEVKCIGFMSFTTLQQKRIFIPKSDIYNWGYNGYYSECVMDSLSLGSLEPYFQPPGGPYFNSLIGQSFAKFLISSTLCVDCRYKGGTTTPPPFWP